VEYLELQEAVAVKGLLVEMEQQQRHQLILLLVETVEMVKQIQLLVHL
jgi:hypothetical protein